MVLKIVIQRFQDNFWVLLIQAWPWAKHLPIIGQKGYKDVIANISQVETVCDSQIVDCKFKYQAFIEDEVNKVAKEFDTHQEPTNFIQSYLREMDKNKQLEFVFDVLFLKKFW